jgi:hypothetical protein
MLLGARYAERVAPEIFRWLGWSTALAAVQVVAIRTGSGWLKWLPFVLAAFVSMRIQWFIGIKHPEERQPDGSLLIRVKWWRFFIVPVGWVLTWVFAIGAANLIARSDLLPPIESQAKVAPASSSSVTRSVPLAAPAIPSSTVQKSPKVPPKIEPASAVSH